jgi:hypothetical protein
VPKPDRHSRWLTAALALLLIAAALAAVVQGLFIFRGAQPAPTPTLTSTPTSAERLIPTATATLAAALSPSAQPVAQITDVTAPAPDPRPRHTPSPSPTSSPRPTPTPPSETSPSPIPTSLTPSATPSPAPTTILGSGLYPPRQRIGVTAPLADVERYDMVSLGAGWYLPGRTLSEPPRPAGMEVAQFVGVRASSFWPEATELASLARLYPGTLWLVGNEPDVIWQGDSTPQQYTHVYHDVYKVLKAADPSCQIAIGGISQVTPLRLRYLEQILAHYEQTYGQSMPVDVWNIHVAILREERGSWGVDIPPGLSDDTGILFEVQDNARIDIFRDQVWIFRRWMKDRGFRDKPLIVSEFSVLMPTEYGFPFEKVRGFMLDTLNFLLSTADSALGYPPDANRLVQHFAWYSVADTTYSTGNLFDPGTAQITPLGEVFARYVAGLEE